MSENDSGITAAGRIKSGLRGWRGIALAALVLVVCAGGYYSYQSYSKADTQYLTMPVTSGSIVDAVETTGTVTPLREVDLDFETQGVLKTLNIKTGDIVKKGQVLAAQDDTDFKIQVEQAESDLQLANFKVKQNQMEYTKASTAYERQKVLFVQGALAKSDLETAENTLQTAALNLESAQASQRQSQVKLVKTQNDLRDSVLHAPFDGIAAEVNGDVGQGTTKDATVLFHLISTEQEVKAQVNEVDIGRIQEGQDVTLTSESYPNRSFYGIVSRISPQAATVNNIQLYEAIIALDDPDHKLMPGMSVNAKVLVDQRNDVTMVPTIAFNYAQTYQRSLMQAGMNGSSGGNKPSGSFGSGSGNQRTGQTGGMFGGNRRSTNSKRVVVLVGNKPVLKTVTTGLSDGQNTEAVSGLKPGDKVIIGTNQSQADAASGIGGGSNSGNSSGQRSGNQSRGGGGMFMPH